MEAGGQEPDTNASAKWGLLSSLRAAVHSLFQIPYSAEEVFGDPLDLAALYDALAEKVGRDQSAADRLVAFEHQFLPSAIRFTCARNAIQRLEAHDDSDQPAS